MSVPQPANLHPHEVAKAQIEAWRGRCINIFARGEKSVVDCLVAASGRPPAHRLEPLAGQRLNSLEKLADENTVTKAQHEALIAAIATWRSHDEHRPVFSHGVATELLDRQGIWYVQFDFVAVHKGAGTPVRRTFSKSEAETFEASLHQAFTRLAGQLGQWRKRLGT